MGRLHCGGVGELQRDNVDIAGFWGHLGGEVFLIGERHGLVHDGEEAFPIINGVLVFTDVDARSGRLWLRLRVLLSRLVFEYGSRRNAHTSAFKAVVSLAFSNNSKAFWAHR